jgi:hypothetical protein
MASDNYIIKITYEFAKGNLPLTSFHLNNVTKQNTFDEVF